MNAVEAAWVAGLLEGEGTFSLSQKANSRRYPALVCGMTDHDVLLKLQRIAGGTLSGPHWAEKSTKPYWTWQQSRRTELRELLLAIQPHLGQRRETRVAEQLARIDELEMEARSRLLPCGTRAKYERGCRCEPCTRARYWHNVAMKQRRAEQVA